MGEDDPTSARVAAEADAAARDPGSLVHRAFCPLCDGIDGHLPGCTADRPPPVRPKPIPIPEPLTWKRVAGRALRALAARLDRDPRGK